MVGMRYRKDRGMWEVDVRRRGERSRPQFHSKATAQEYRRKMEDIVDRERNGMDFVEPITFENFSKIFIENHFKEKAARYASTCEGKIKNQFIPAFGIKDMSEITLGDVSQWRAGREGKVSPKTLIDDISLLNTMFTAAIKNGYASSNPVADIQYPQNIPAKKRQAVQDAILRQGLRSISGIDLLMILALRNSGLRKNELFHLDFDDFDFENKLIRVKSVTGKTTKNYLSRMTILTPTFESIINLLGVKQGRIFKTPYKTFENRFCRIKKEVGFTWDVHSLRHSFVTKLRSANIPERIVAHYVGHSAKSQTDTYTSYLPEFVDSAIRAVDFGSEFLKEPQNVVTMRPPRSEDSLRNNYLRVAGAGFEPGHSIEINGLASVDKKLKNQRVWKKA